MKKFNVILAVLAVALLSCGLAQATLLPPGATVVPSVGPGQPPPGANAVASLLAQPFASASFSGTIDTFVYNMDPANPFGPTGLDFVYQVHVTGGPNPLERLTLTDFTGLLTDVAQNVDGPGSVAAISASRTATGNSIGWDFPANTGIGAGVNSFFLEVRTNALTFGSGTANFIDGSVATARILAPVPDGGSALALLGMALTGIEFFRRKLKAT